MLRLLKSIYIHIINENLQGGKGANLLRLARYGFNVPQGFVLNTTAYDLFVASNNLGEKIEKISSQLTIDNLKFNHKGNIY